MTLLSKYLREEQCQRLKEKMEYLLSLSTNPKIYKESCFSYIKMIPSDLTRLLDETFSKRCLL